MSACSNDIPEPEFSPEAEIQACLLSARIALLDPMLAVEDRVNLADAWMRLAEQWDDRCLEMVLVDEELERHRTKLRRDK
jgi:hypothetical protein